MLGKLESAIMEIVWSIGKASVQDVAHKLRRPLAYTTVMTTLDRLYKKGLLDCDKERRAFRYSPKMSRLEWERRQAFDWFIRFLTSSSDSDLLLTSLVHAVGELDHALLDELEQKVALRRKQLATGAATRTYLDSRTLAGASDQSIGPVEYLP